MRLSRPRSRGTLPDGRDELQAVHNAALVQICEVLGIPVDVRMRKVDEVQRKAFAKKARIEPATTMSALEGITWG